MPPATAGASPVELASPRLLGTRALEWTRLVAITGTAQVAVQAIGFVCGLLVIRLLPVEEYAFYTIANTMLGTMSLLADGGIASGVMSQGGKVWRDKEKLGAVLATGMKLRRQFAVYSLIVSTPILFYLLHKQGASWITSSLLTISLLPAFFSALSGKLLEVSLKLHQDIPALQAVQVSANLLRLALSTLTLFVFPFAAVAVLASGASQVYSNWHLRRISGRRALPGANEDATVRAEILRLVRRTLPGAIYYCIAGQITVWLLAIFGSVDSIASIGAIGRLTAILAVVQTLLESLAIPRFSRLPSDSLALHRFVLMQLALFVVAAIATVLAYAYSGPITSILGPSYAGMQLQFQLIVIASLLQLASAVTYGLAASRAVIAPPIVTYLSIAGTQAAAIYFFDCSTINGAVAVSITTYCVTYAIRATHTFVSLWSNARDPLG